MDVVIFDIDQKKIELARQVTGNQIKCIVADVSKMKLREGEAVATAGNSFGIMDGVLDKAIEQAFPFTQAVVQETIVKQFFGELPIGCAVSVKQPNGTLIIYAPTMQVPMQLAHSANSYYATLAALREATDKKIDRLYLPLFGCGTGGLPVQTSLEQILYAIEQATSMQVAASLGNVTLDWEYAVAVHSKWHRMTGIDE